MTLEQGYAEMKNLLDTLTELGLIEGFEDVEPDQEFLELGLKYLEGKISLDLLMVNAPHI